MDSDPALMMHSVLERIFAVLTLHPTHEDALRHQGSLHLETAKALGYVSFPSDRGDVQRLLGRLIADFGQDRLAQMPWFSRTRSGKGIAFKDAARLQNALLLPLYNEGGLFAGFAWQHPGADTGVQQGNWRHAGQNYTFAGAEYNRSFPQDLWVVEDAHTANLVHHLAHRRTLGLPRFNPDGGQVTDIVQAIERDDPDIIVEAFAPLKFEAGPLQRLRQNFLAVLQEHFRNGFKEVRTAVWYQGEGASLADLLQRERQPRIYAAPAWFGITERPVVPAPPVSPPASAVPLEAVINQGLAAATDFVERIDAHAGELLVVPTGWSPGLLEETSRVAIRHGIRTRIIVGTKVQAESLAHAFHGQVKTAAGRDEANCANFDVIHALRSAGYQRRVGEACRACTFRERCQTTSGQYLNQFVTGPDMVMVATGPWLRSSDFRSEAQLIILGEPDLVALLLGENKIGRGDLERACQETSQPEVQDVLAHVLAAVHLVPTGDGLKAPVHGVRAWEFLAWAYGSQEALLRAIRALPEAGAIAGALAAPFDAAGTGDIRKALPGSILPLLELLREEAADFEKGYDFNSGLSLDRHGVWVRKLQRPAFRAGMTTDTAPAVLLLAATPVRTVINRFATEHSLHLLDWRRPVVATPEYARVVQVIDATYSRSAVSRKKAIRRAAPPDVATLKAGSPPEFGADADDYSGDGPERARGQAQLLASLEWARKAYPGRCVGVICHQDMVAAATALGIERQYILTFHGLRGLAALAACDVVHILGKPEAPFQQSLARAQALHRTDPRAVGTRLVAKERVYHGYRDGTGAGRSVTIHELDDPRARVLQDRARDDELLHAVHAALSTKTMTWTAASAMKGAGTTGREMDVPSSRVTVVLHTKHPVYGLHVDELVTAFPERPSISTERHEDAVSRVLEARDELLREGKRASINAIALRAGADWRTVRKILRLSPGRASLETVTEYRREEEQGSVHPYDT